MRIFIALDIENAIRQRIARFMEGVREFAPDARWVRVESLHVTLKFIGERSPDAIEQIKHAMSAIQAEAVPLCFRGFGFFPNPKAARVFWIGIEAGPQLTHLARLVDEATHRLGIPKEDHAFSPHLTLARGGGGSGVPKRQKGDGPNRNFQRLQEKLLAISTPEFGTMTASEFFLYKSQLSPGGSLYTKLDRFPLR